MNKTQIAKTLHVMLSAFCEANGQPAYDAWEDLKPEYVELLEGAIDLVSIKCAVGDSLTPSDIHDYWMEWAKTHKSDHNCIVPFDELSPLEKAKDALIISIIVELLINFPLIILTNS